ncbi:MAG: hypothetical protein WCT77_05495, partial [Bacteroidota bacterium]
MSNAVNKKREFPCKPEWRIILSYLVTYDQSKLYRICRKMIIFLDRKKIPEIGTLIEHLNPSQFSLVEEQQVGQNWPKPKGSPFIANEIIDKVFEIADEYLSDSEIATLLSQWLLQENLSFFSNMMEGRSVPLLEITEALKRYLELVPDWDYLTINERIGIRVALIIRFLSENLTYINIAKHHITILGMNKIIDRVYGSALGNGKLGGKSAGLVLARQVLIDKKRKNPLLAN